MDWSELRTLALGLSCPQHFFEEIGSQLIGLKSLTMGMGTGPRSNSPWRNSPWESGPMTCETLEPATQFIVSLPGLHELHITDLDAATETIVLPYSKLKIHCRHYRTMRRRTVDSIDESFPARRQQHSLMSCGR